MPAGSDRLRELVVRTAEAALAEKEKYRYAKVRPMAGALLDPEAHERTDCSAFVTLCYKAAGAPDPNGAGYDGTGYTGTLVQHGRWTDDPRPGDLVFYGETEDRPVHVALYVGGGEAITFGCDPMAKVPVDYRADILGYKTYPV